ncbi:hypothetical protein [Vibrio sp. WXL103]|uniref:hypothetical protein n=1 Tax=unclassified Vibrio TaxID=2614977 RepID=UPI003EC8D1ED
MPNKTLLAVALTTVLAGCAGTPEYTGQGEYFELYSINLVERDLSVFKPTQIVTTHPAIAQPAPKPKPKAAVPTYTVRPGERYQAAIVRWLRDDEGYFQIAWSMSHHHSSVVDQVSESALSFEGSLKKAVSLLSIHLDIPLNIIIDEQHKVAGVFDFDGDARITHVTGRTIRSVTERVVRNYGLRWNNTDDFSRSWLAQDDFEFGADYYLLTKKNDIETALATVLDEYPLYSSIVESTGQVIIQEEL